MNDKLIALPEKNLGLIRGDEAGFLRYLRQIQKFPILTAEEEREYAIRFTENQDKEAAKMLIQSHLRLVAKMAMKFKNYGLPVVELVSEGNIGLIQALKKFDPQKGFRFSTYAMWWIKAYIQEYILRSWSLVKIGTTAAQKKLFFNLHKIKKKLQSAGTPDSSLSQKHIEIIARDLNVSKKEVTDMDSRLSQGDTSLNNLVGEGDDAKEMVDLMTDNQESQEDLAIKNQKKSHQEALFKMAFSTLNDREKDILIKRQMSEISLTLEDLSKIYNISRERIRQIEESSINKIRKEIYKLQNKAT